MENSNVTITTQSTGTVPAEYVNSTTTVDNEEQPVTPTAEESKPSLEELQAQIKALEEERDKLKKATSNACSDAADWKRKYRSTLDENTRKEQEQAERVAEMEKTLAAYKRKDITNSHTDRLIAAGYDHEAAKELAQYLPEDVPEEFFAKQKSYMDAQKQLIKTQVLNSQPSLSVGMPPVPTNGVSTEDNNIRKWMGLPQK